MTQFIPRHRADSSVCLTAATTGDCPENHLYYGGDLTPEEGRDLILNHSGELIVHGRVTPAGLWAFTTMADAFTSEVTE